MKALVVALFTFLSLSTLGGHALPTAHAFEIASQTHLTAASSETPLSDDSDFIEAEEIDEEREGSGPSYELTADMAAAFQWRHFLRNAFAEFRQHSSLKVLVPHLRYFSHAPPSLLS